MSTFKSKKNGMFYIAVSTPILFLLGVTIYDFVSFENRLTTIELLSRLGIAMVFILFIFLLNRMNYTIEENKLKIKSIIFKKEFDIQKFKSITRNKKRFIPTEKAALSSKGIIIRYSTYDEIFISPENEIEFIQELKNCNPSIEIDID